MSVVNYVYVMLRVSDEGYGYDTDYPVEAVFTSLDDALDYRDDLVKQMREDGDIEEGTEDDEVLEIISRPLHVKEEQQNVLGQIVEPPKRNEWVDWKWPKPK